jgi:vitamin B12 transporter
MFYFHLTRAVVCVTFLCGCFSSSAQVLSSSQTLEEVQISAPKYPEKLQRSGKVTSIISSDQIQSAMGKNLAELLQEQVGISIVGARSAPGSNQEVYVRGSNTGHVLVLVDGFPINDPSHISQVWDWNLINLSSLERIEILKGGQSTLYGSDAMAAVINLVTKKSDVDQLQTRVQLQAGGFGTYSPQVQFLGKLKKWQYRLMVKDFFTQGFSAADVKNGEKDGFRQQNADISLSRPLGNHSYLDVFYQFQKYRGNLDAGPFQDELDYTSAVNSSSIRFQYQRKLAKADVFLRGFSDVIHRAFKNDSTFVPIGAYSSYFESNYQGLNNGLELYGKVRLGLNSLGILGAELRNQTTQQSDFSFSSYGRYDSPEINESLAKRSILAIYATFQQSWNDRLGFEIGSRWNQPSTFGNFATVNVNPYWLPRAQMKVFANYSTGFKVPSLYQLFSPYGNLALVPETGSTSEIGWENQHASWKYRLVLFKNSVKDGIIFQAMDKEPYGQYVNVSRQSTQGLEAEMNYVGKKWQSQLNYTYLNGSVSTRVGGKDSTYSSLIRRPRHTVSWRLTYQYNARWKMALSNQWLDDRTDYVYDEKVFSVVAKNLDAYYWTDWQLFYQVSGKVGLGLLVKNVFNRKIQELYGYNGQNRNVQINLDFRF